MIQILTGDALAVLRGMEAGRFHCCVTSPPYHALRDYGTGTWNGGDPDCNHKRIERVMHAGRQGNATGTPPGAGRMGDEFYRGLCAKCGAVRVDGQLGLEEDFEVYLSKLVEIFEEIRRVLRDDGTAWVNMGDNFVDKSLRGQPWRLAFALRDAGWYLRSEIIWHKPNPMPESVEDRPTKAHEQIFLLSKRAKYFYDAEAVREPQTSKDNSDDPSGRSGVSRDEYEPRRPDGPLTRERIAMRNRIWNPSGRNLRTVWTVPSHAFSEAHFATFPPDLIIPCIKAGTSERGCCPECGAAWRRETERTSGPDQSWAQDNNPTAKESHLVATGQRGGHGKLNRGSKEDYYKNAARSVTLGFRPTCEHGREPVPCRVLDPFFGAGTTGLVSDRLGRDCTGIELNPAYAAMAEKRLRADCPMFARVEITP